jgi:hypothetical protein
VPADVRSCTPVPLRNLHGKEGVDGSSPSEGFPAKQPVSAAGESSFESQIGPFAVHGALRLETPAYFTTASSRARRKLSFVAS